MSESDTERPIEVHARGPSYAIVRLSVDEYQRLQDGEEFWEVVADVREQAPAGDWDWSLCTETEQPEEVDRDV